MPTFNLITQTSVGSGGANTVTLNNIPLIYDDLRLFILARATTGSSNFEVRFNGDATGSIYLRAYAYYNTSSTTVPSANNSASTMIGLVTPSTYDAGTFAGNDFVIPGYRRNTEKTMYGITAMGFYSNAGHGTIPRIYNIGNTWTITQRTPITSITLIGDTTFAEYTSISLYGIKQT